MACVGFVLAVAFNLIVLISYGVAALISIFSQKEQFDASSLAKSLSSLVTMPIGLAVFGVIFSLAHNLVVRKLDLGIGIEIQKEEKK